ncbi:hypothetical protein CCB81_13200 [Armatimonadetes bacterium Uphvl-Ar2]|nr:hypothetical protein CCB81_13200 [Armatimonadetes bacterium Uphvl-Ar2]
MAYNGYGDVTSSTDPTGLQTSATYDLIGRVATVTIRRATSLPPPGITGGASRA